MIRLAFVVVVTILIFVGAMMYWATAVQMNVYSQGIDAAMAGKEVNHSAAITYSRAITAAVIKTSSVFLAFVLIFLGGIYVLMPGQAKYSLDVSMAGGKGTLATTSPGLIMISLGIVLTIAALSIRNEISYKQTGPPQSPAIDEMVPVRPAGPSDYVPYPASGERKQP